MSSRYGDTFTRGLVDQIQRDLDLRAALFPQYARHVDIARTLIERDRWHMGTLQATVSQQMRQAAEVSLAIQLPTGLIAYQTPIDDLAQRLARSTFTEIWTEPAYLKAFTQASALSNVFEDNRRVTAALTAATAAFGQETWQHGSLTTYRELLDAAGITLNRWPNARLLRLGERRRQFQDRLKAHAPPTHVKKAKSLVYRYEKTLREVIGAAMTECYGPDWPEERLPLCEGGKSLLNKWKSRGVGEVLDHADYFHYAKIVTNKEHFTAIFEWGFDDPDDADRLLIRAGDLRAASHHGRDFSPDDLRDLRVTWRTIELALVAIELDYQWEA